jgi:hypothetical protein
MIIMLALGPERAIGARVLTIFHDPNLTKSAERASERISLAQNRLFGSNQTFLTGSFQRLISSSPGGILRP